MKSSDPSQPLGAVQEQQLLSWAARLVRLVCGPTPTPREWEIAADGVRRVAQEMQAELDALRSAVPLSGIEGPAGGVPDFALTQKSESTGTFDRPMVRQIAQWIGSGQLRLMQKDANMDDCIVDPFTNGEKRRVARLLNMLSNAFELPALPPHRVGDKE